MRFHCLFEQSGTFRDVFKSYGHEAYDIQNEYGQTDFQIDLFKEIEIAYYNLTLDTRMNDFKRKTIFDNMEPETDFIMAFFPCTYFSEQNELVFKQEGINKKYEHLKRQRTSIERTLERVKERADMFALFIKFCFVCQEFKIPTIIENPSSPIKRTYLELYSPYRPSYRESNRTLFGDRYIKPTNFYSINFEMKENFMMFDLEINRKAIKTKTGEQTRKLKGKGIEITKNKRERSKITSRYADNFYKRFLQQYCESSQLSSLKIRRLRQ